MRHILLLVGESGSGKTTVADILQNKYGYKQLQSYTTRSPRYENEQGHIFITKQDFCKIDKNDMVAYTYYNDNHYFATSQQVDENDVYVIDIKGIEYFKDKYKGNKHPYVVYLQVPEEIRKERMLNRNDDINKVQERIDIDKQEFKQADKFCNVVMQNLNSEETAAYLNYVLIRGETSGL